MKRALIVLIASSLAMAATEPLTIIAHNDGTAEKLKVGQRVAFVGMIYVGMHGTWIGNYIPEPPAAGTKAAPNADEDFVCADLLVPVTENQGLFRLEGKRVTAIGTVRSVRTYGPGRCPLALGEVTIRPR